MCTIFFCYLKFWPDVLEELAAGLKQDGDQTIETRQIKKFRTSFPNIFQAFSHIALVIPDQLYSDWVSEKIWPGWYRIPK